MAKKDDLNLGKKGAKGGKKGEAEESEGGGKGKLIIIIVAVLLLLGGGGAAAYFLVFAGGGDDEAGEEVVDEEPPAEPIYLDMKKILVDIQFEGRTHYVQAEMQLMSYDQEVINQAFRDLPAIRDRLIMVMSGSDFEALKTVEGKEALRSAALRAINRTLELTPPKVINEVYFENFVLQ